MDDRRFDALARLLATGMSRRAALGAVLAGMAGMGVDRETGEARRRRRRRRCGTGPACPSGQVCIDGECGCDGGGLPCGGACCPEGERCEQGACVASLECLPLAAACGRGAGRCCDGLACASGQGGTQDVACWRPAGSACASTTECVFGSECRDGACTVVRPPAPTPDPTPEPPDCTVCATGCPHDTIAGALADPALDVVTVDAGTWREAGLRIERSLTLQACGTGPVTIDAERRGRAILIPRAAGTAPGADVVIRDITILNGVASDREQQGGGIMHQGGSLTLEGVVVSGCSTADGGISSATGGGIFALESGPLTIRDSTVTDCRAVVGGGIAVINAASAALENVTISNSRAEDGGGLLALGPSIALSGCRITGCAADRGGGIFATAQPLSVTDTMISGNHAADTGGGIHLQNFRLELSGATDVSGNTAGNAGAGIYNHGGVNISADTPVVCLGGSVSVCGNAGAAAFDDCAGVDNLPGWKAPGGPCGCCTTAGG